MLWVATLFVALMGLAAVGYGMQVLQSPAILQATLAIGFIVLSWLGASVFGSDANHGRIRFLAERGVSPFKIWWTRLALPLICVIVGLFVYVFLNKASAFFPDVYQESSLPRGVSGGLMTLGVLMTFGFTHWLPQLSRSALIAYCISPVLAVVSFVYVAFLLNFINPPWWLVVVSIGISFAATRIMLRPWMDGRTGFKYWLSHGVLLAVTLCVPLIPFLITFATYPGMPTALRKRTNGRSRAV